MASYSPQTDALMQRLRPAGAAPATTSVSPFARGGKVTQLPGSGVKEQVGNLAGSIGTQIAAKQLGGTAAQTAAGTAAQTGLKSALTSGASGAAAGAGVSLATGMLADKLRKKEEQPIFGGPNGQYLDDKGRRFEGTGGGTHSNMVKYAGMGANPALAASTMGLSVAGGALFGLAKAAATRNAPSAYTDFRVEDGADAIKAAYKNELGRDASDDEVMGMLQGQGWDPNGGDRWVGEKGINSVLDHIRASPEAQAYRAGGGGAAGEPTVETSVPEGATRSGGAVADALGAGGGDPFSTGTKALQAKLAPAAAAQPTIDLSGRAGQGSGALEERLGLPPGSIQTATGAAGAGLDTAAPEAAAPMPGSEAWNTEGYQAPQHLPASVGNVMPGWDATNWNDPNMQTPKYGVGRILSNFPGTLGGLKQAMPEIIKAYPGTTFDGKDKISIPGVGDDIDVLINAVDGDDNSGSGFQWPSEGGDAGGAAAGAGAGPSLIDATGGASNQGDVQAIIAQLIGREGQQSETGLAQALLNKMRATA
jgi:hypothetical protein